MSNPAFVFDHVHIIARDPRASAQWYVDKLGATIAADTIARGAPQIFVDLGDDQHVIFKDHSLKDSQIWQNCQRLRPQAAQGEFQGDGQAFVALFGLAGDKAG